MWLRKELVDDVGTRARQSAAAMNDVLDSIEAKSKGTGDADDTNKTEQQTKKETVMKNANEKGCGGDDEKDENGDRRGGGSGEEENQSKLKL